MASLSSNQLVVNQLNSSDNDSLLLSTLGHGDQIFSALLTTVLMLVLIIIWNLKQHPTDSSKKT